MTETETFVAFLKKAWKRKSRERKSFNDQHFNARRKKLFILDTKSWKRHFVSFYESFYFALTARMVKLWFLLSAGLTNEFLFLKSFSEFRLDWAWNKQIVKVKQTWAQACSTFSDIQLIFWGEELGIDQAQTFQGKKSARKVPSKSQSSWAWILSPVYM